MILFLAYTAHANDYEIFCQHDQIGNWPAKLTTRCFCPPLSVKPPLPTKVESPAGNISRSFFNAQASRTVSYKSSSKSEPERTLSRTLVLTSHAVWSQKATSGIEIRMSPFEQVAPPSMALSSTEFPLPMGPTIIVKEDRAKWADISFKIGLPPVFSPKDTSSIEIIPSPA